MTSSLRPVKSIGWRDARHVRRAALDPKLPAVQQRLWRSWLRAFTDKAPAAGLTGALLLFGLSLTPSLLPRTWQVQGVVSGVSAAVGYGLGAALHAAVRRVKPNRPSAARARGGLLAILVATIVAIGWVAAHVFWLVDVRRLMGIERNLALYMIAVPVVAVFTTYVLVVAGRLVRSAFGAIERLLSRRLPRRWAIAILGLAALPLAVTIVDVMIAGKVFGSLDKAYLAADSSLDDTVPVPTTTLRSGGPGSLISWNTLGRQGRHFVAGGPNAAALEAFNGAAALEPIRVYAGLGSAGTPAERARLAVAELERTGAFSRRALVVITTTGTGWVDPHGIDPVEYLYNGDTAAVAIQYSYLPSWFVMLTNQDLSKEAGRALFQQVRARWEQIPEPSRPELLLYGESLGVFGSEAMFADPETIGESTDGVLWVGPPRASRLWSHFTSRRNPSSPVWQPVYGNGDRVRFGWDGESLSQPGGDWPRPRVVYLQQGSDPITWWSSDLLFGRPDWMRQPRSPGVSERMFFVPIATFLQTTLDLLVSTDVPEGHGHRFGTAQAEAWAAILEPPGWTPQDTRRLVAALAS